MLKIFVNLDSGQHYGVNSTIDNNSTHLIVNLNIDRSICVNAVSILLDGNKPSIVFTQNHLINIHTLHFCYTEQQNKSVRLLRNA